MRDRVKPYTDFHGRIESGLMKMIAIGLGRQKGADSFHREGMERFSTLIPAVGLFTISHVNIPFGIALFENGYGRLSHMEEVKGNGILEREPELLKPARQWLGRLPGECIDSLLVGFPSSPITTGRRSISRWQRPADRPRHSPHPPNQKHQGRRRVLGI